MKRESSIYIYIYPSSVISWKRVLFNPHSVGILFRGIGRTENWSSAFVQVHDGWRHHRKNKIIKVLL